MQQVEANKSFRICCDGSPASSHLTETTKSTDNDQFAQRRREKNRRKNARRAAKKRLQKEASNITNSFEHPLAATIATTSAVNFTSPRRSPASHSFSSPALPINQTLTTPSLFYTPTPRYIPPPPTLHIPPPPLSPTSAQHPSFTRASIEVPVVEDMVDMLKTFKLLMQFMEQKEAIAHYNNALNRGFQNPYPHSYYQRPSFSFPPFSYPASSFSSPPTMSSTPLHEHRNKYNNIPVTAN
jgi:hypothetical protein